MRSTSASSTTGSDPVPFTTCLALAWLVATPGATPQAPGPLHFTDVAGESGLRFEHNFGADKLENVLMTTGGGCALFDYDNDGRLDAFLVNGTRLDEQGEPVKDRVTRHLLFHNEGDGTFENVTRKSGITRPTYGQGCACADIDGDGFVDLYVTNYGPNRMYRNRGDGTFEGVSGRSRTDDPRWSTGAVFFDHDGDGDLDLFVANYLRFRPDGKGVHASSLSKRSGFRFFPGPRDYEAEEDAFYRNEGGGSFTDVSEDVGLVSGGKGLSAIAADLDDDGDQDLFVANDATPNFLYRNDGGKLAEIAFAAGVAFDPDGVETAGMGVDIADVDGDGRQDLYVTNMVFEFNNLYMNRGGMLFKDMTRSRGLHKDNYRHVGWAARFADFDHDGSLDCFIANGHVVDYVEGFSEGFTYRQRNMLFLGDSSGRFRDASDTCGEDFGRMRVSRGGAFGDVDGDGDIDILLVNSGGRAELLRNDLPANDRWIRVRLKGAPPNTQAIGAKVVARFGERSVRTEVRCAGSYLSSSDPTLHFGLRPGEEEGILEVTWPSGRRSSHGVRPGTLTVVEEGDAPADGDR